MFLLKLNILNNLFAFNRHYIFIFELAFPVVDVYPRNQTVLEGRPTVMNCTAKGVPRPTLSWTFDNGELPPDAATRNFSGQSILRLSKTSKSVEGWYTCKAKNKAGAACSNTTLHVLGLLVFFFSLLSDQPPCHYSLDVGYLSSALR